MVVSYSSNHIKSPQNWRQAKKKYFLNKAKKNTSGFGSRGGVKKYSGGNNKNPLKIKWPKPKTIFIGLLALFIFGYGGFLWLTHDLPDPNRLIERQVPESTKIYDRTGQTILYEIHGDQKRTMISLKDVPENLKNATISIEDKDFYKHGGFSLWAIFRTIITDIFFGKTAGGSTLTQQFVKNAVLTNEKTFTRKIKEIILAYRLEKKFSKDEILQMYFNEIPYGSTAYGVEAASQKYFGKSARDLNLAESAILAAIPQAPSRYSPYGPNKDTLLARQKYILDLMAKYGYITKDQAAEAKNTPLTFKAPSDNMMAPHFVMYIKELLADKYGEKTIEQGGLKIYTTLDLYKQKIAEEVISEKAPGNEKKYGATNAALISIDPKNGQVLAMVGSRDYFNDDIDGQVNVALQSRQPGSSFKPIVYTASFIKGYTPQTVLYDVVTNFSTDPAKPYEPHNYDSKEHGPVTIKQALAGSLNIPAVKAIYLTGIDNVISLAQNLGYTTLNDKNRFGLSLVLGGGEVKLLEHTNAFSAFAREGVKHPVAVILKVEDKDGKVLEEFKNLDEKVLEPDIARQTNSILSDNSARAYIFGANNSLTLGSRPVAAKTGTTNDYRDAWTIGYTPSLVTGVWVGNNDNTEMKRGADGSIVAAPIWHDYMNKVLGNTPIEYFNAPENKPAGKPILDGVTDPETTVKIDKFSGLLANEFTPASAIIEKQFKQAHCILYYINKDDPRGPAPANPKSDPQFNLWENAVLAWAKKQGIINSPAPTEYDNIHRPELNPVISIDSPKNNQTITSQLLNAQISASASRGISRAEYYIDGYLFGAAASYPFSLNKSISALINGSHELTARVCDDIDNCAEQKIRFNLVNNSRPRTSKINVTLIQPAEGANIIKYDFPLSLKAEVTNQDQVAGVIFYLKDASGNAQKIIQSQVINEIAEAQITNALTPGSYKLYAEAHGWQGQTALSEEVSITINNMSQTATTTPAAAQ
ncbi:MAG: PBP1A family penicillin-binding protein [Patescibacteria group bacterium]|nr:PBP1A family penicillin-binding protein [Patescibacteria group bacterium]